MSVVTKPNTVGAQACIQLMMDVRYTIYIHRISLVLKVPIILYLLMVMNIRALNLLANKINRPNTNRTILISLRK